MQNRLTIRNATSLSLLLRNVEYFDDSNSNNKKTFKVNFRGLRRANPANEYTLDGGVTLLGQYEVDTAIGPFSFANVAVSRTEDGQENAECTQLVRLTLFTEGSIGKWQIALPSITHSETAPVVVRTTSDLLYGIYFSDWSLALFTNVVPNDWMRRLPDTLPLSALSIPGTHNSPAYHKALPSVRCQAVSILDQLNNGIRFLDVRVQVDSPSDQGTDELTLVHGNFGVARSGSRKFRDLYSEILSFLQRNPSETIIMSLKREGTGSAHDSHLAQRLYSHYITDGNWVLSRGIPTLGAARGKIVLFRRFKLSEELRQQYGCMSGINASQWADNSPNSPGGDVHIQDLYEVSESDDVEQKIEYVKKHCARAVMQLSSQSVAIIHEDERSQRRMFVNFLSASNFWKPGYWPEKIAAMVNPAVTRFLCERHGTEYGAMCPAGLLVCDFVGERGDWSLVKVIVGMNERLMQQEAP